MSDKKLLNENTVRRFMKLASLEPISNTFIKETFQEELDEVESAEETENLEENETENLEEMGGYGAREDEEPEMDAAPEEDQEDATPHEVQKHVHRGEQGAFGVRQEERGVAQGDEGELGKVQRPTQQAGANEARSG